MIRISRKLADLMINHCLQDAPKEACGILAGKDCRVRKVYRTANKDDSAKTFFMDPGQQLKVFKEMRRSGLEMLGIYHSHSETEAYPSRHDVEMAFYPEASYVIVSIKDKDAPAIKSYKIKDGNVSEEEVRIA